MTSLKLYACVTLAILCVGPSAFADTSPTSVPTSDAKTTKKVVDQRLDDQTIVCKREEATGTRLGATKTCHTRSEWAVQASEARSQVDGVQRTQLPTPPR